MDLVRVRKELAGADSFGHVWAEDGAVVEMPYDQAMALLAIPDAGCTVVDEPAAPPAEEPADETAEAPPADNPAQAETPASSRRTRSRSAKASGGGA